MQRAAFVFIISLSLECAWPCAAWAGPFKFTIIDVPVGIGTTVSGINDAGQIVGNFIDDQGSHGFLLSEGTFTTIDPIGPPCDCYSHANGINDAGQIVGNFNPGGAGSGFLLSEGTFTTIEAPFGYRTDANGINDAGQIVGDFFTGSWDHGFLLSEGSEAYRVSRRLNSLNQATAAWA